MPTISYVAEDMNLIGNSYQCSLQSTNKALMRDAFLAHGVASPDYLKLSPFDTSKLHGLSFPVIVKPLDRSGSRGVTKAYNDRDLEDAILKARHESITKTVIVEEFVDGCEVSVECISWEGKHYFIAITDKVTTGEPYFVEIEHHQPSLLPLEIQSKIKDETIKALNALDILYGASHTELLVTKAGEVYLVEVGARMGGDFIGSHLVPLSTGYDFLKGVIDCALNQFQEPVPELSNCSGVYFLCKNTEHLKTYFNCRNQFEVEKKILKDDLKFVTNSNDRSGYLIYQHSSKIILS